MRRFAILILILSWLPACAASNTNAARDDQPPAVTPEPAAPAAEPDPAAPEVSVTPSAGEAIMEESPYSCADVGGECMEGCEPGFMVHDTPHRPCHDSVCCVAESTPTCADVGGECMEGCEPGSRAAPGPTRGCVDAACCVAAE